MPGGTSVKPKKWKSTRVLFDDGEYSVISGQYDGGTHSVLGERWNGDDGQLLGFPNVSGHPVWHVVPDFLAVSMLQALLARLAVIPLPKREKFSKEIQRELIAQYELQVRSLRANYK